MPYHTLLGNLIMKNNLTRAGATVLGAFMLSACSKSYFPNQNETDAHVQHLLANTPDMSSLERKYHPMSNEDDSHAGVVFIRQTEFVEKTHSNCATYNAFAVNPDDDDGAFGEESLDRKVCIPVLKK